MSGFSPFFGGLNGDPDGPWDDDDSWDGGYGPPEELTCKYCSASGFVWKKTKNNKWWLWDEEEDKWHSCERRTR